MDSDRSDMVRTQLVYDANRKSVGVAYLLWLFLGGFGAHRFYLGRTVTATIQLTLFVLGWLTVWIVIGAFPLAFVAVWLLIDAFLIPGMAREHNAELADALTEGKRNHAGFGAARLAH